MMFAGLGMESPTRLTLYTDSLIVHGTIRTRQRRVSDVLNAADDPFIVLEDVTSDEYGSRATAVRSDYAQINLDAVLFAVSDTPVDAVAELRTQKSPEQAMVSIPPFRLTGTIHLLPGRDLREALVELQGRFLPLTDATYWSDIVNEPRSTARIIAFNHNRAQILAPHREVDPWAGLSTGGAEGGGEAAGGSWNEGDQGTTPTSGW
jgi:hypothetical protein